MFGLVAEWIDEVTGELYEHQIDWFRTKEELTAKKELIETAYNAHIAMGRLILYPIVRYDWDEIINLF